MKERRRKRRCERRKQSRQEEDNNDTRETARRKSKEYRNPGSEKLRIREIAKAPKPDTDKSSDPDLEKPRIP